MSKNISRLYSEELGIVIGYEIYEGDIHVYLNECVYNGTDICPSVSDMAEYNITTQWQLKDFFYNIVKEHLLEGDVDD